MATQSALSIAPNLAADPKSGMRDYYDKISGSNLAPLWEVLAGLVTPEPVIQAVPAIWHMREVKPLIEEAGRRITAKQAERRVLILENPALRGQSKISHSLFAGLQMILPGEIAPPHRHTASAIRFILDGEGAYTQVEGEKTIMSPGDFVITANWCAHDHGNTSDRPMIWLDVLDMHAVNFFGAMFSEHLGEDAQNTKRESGDSVARFASGVLPEGTNMDQPSTPIVNYEYRKMRPILDRLQRAGEIDPYKGARIHYMNPLDGGPVTPVLGAHLSLLPNGFTAKPYRSTDSHVFVCVEGAGVTEVDGQAMEWSQGDVFVVPSWKRFTHRASKDSVLFGISDKPAQKALALWREEKH